MQQQAMTLRMELFVTDLDRAIAFYLAVLGFVVERREHGYASLRHGQVLLGLGLVANLPETDGYFTQARLRADRGAGVEIVLEVDDLEHVYAHVRSTGHPLHEDIQARPWGLRDFRIVDPDGYYLRLTSRD